MQMTIFDPTTGHRTTPSAHFIYTFDLKALERARDGRGPSAIVHHGVRAVPEGFIEAHAHHEGLALFASRSSGVVDLDSEALAALLSGRIRNWRELGGYDAPVEIAVRGDGIFGETGRTILRTHGLPLPESFAEMSSYVDLASFASSKPGALVLGLRGVHARHPSLTRLDIVGGAARLANGPSHPLAIRVSLLLRRGDPMAVSLAQRFADSFVANAREDQMESEAIAACAPMHATLIALQEESRYVMLEGERSPALAMAIISSSSPAATPAASCHRSE